MLQKNYLIILFLIINYFTGNSYSQQMFRVDSAHTGYYSTEDIRNPILKWKFETEGKIRSTGVIKKNVLFIGSNDKNFYAINIYDGSLKWVYNTDGIVSSSPAIKDDIVYFYSKDGYFYALNTETGDKMWSVVIEETPTNRDQWDYFLSSPVISNNSIFIGCDNGTLYSINMNEKKIEWKFETDNKIIASPAVDSNNVYFGSFDGYFYVIDRKDGSLVWNYDTESNEWSPKGEVQSSASITDQYVIFATRGEYLYVMNKFTGELLWKYRETNSWFVGSPSVRNDKIYIGDSDGHKFHVFELETGEKLWEINTNHNIFSSPAITDSTVYFGTGDSYNESYKGSLYSVNRISGKINWIYNAGSHIWSSPVLAENIIIFGCDDGFVYALENDETTGIKNDKIKSSFRLYQNYPNPFNPATTISYGVPFTSKITIVIYDVLGRQIKRLVDNETKGMGKYSVRFNAESLPSGIYFYRLTSNSYHESRKMILLK